MPVVRVLLSGLVVALSVACGGSGKGANTPANVAAGHESVTDATRSQLTIPPGATSIDAMRELERLSDQGNVDAAVLHAHYLMDLFDDARFATSEASRNLLGEIAGRPLNAMRGPAATQALAELLVLDADRILELDRRHPQGQALRVLASFDAAGPSNRTGVFQAMQELKRLRSKGGPLAANATLRLFGYCRNALLDAKRFDRAGQRIALSHCLYPLYASDPEPYFADHSEERPPPPRVGRITESLTALVAAPGETRLRAAFDAQKAWIQNFAKDPGILNPVDALGLRLPSVSLVRPYDDAPILGSDTGALASELLADGRGQVAIAFASERPASDLLAAARTAGDVGASSLLLLVSTSQKLRVPEGDYWSDEVGDAPIWRTGQIAFSLARFDEVQNDSPQERSAGTKAAKWNKQHSDLTLHLVVSPSEWTLLSPLGQIARFSVGDKDQSAPAVLQTALIQVRKAYPDEQGMILVPASGASVGALALAAEAAHHRPDGLPLFPRLALAKAAPKVRKGKQLATRIERRALANVSVNPEVLSDKLPAALRCYQELAETKKLASAAVRLELPESGTLAATGGTKQLKACAKAAFGEAMRTTKLRAAEIQFNATAK